MSLWSEKARGSARTALGLVVVEIGVVLQRSGVLGPHDLHGLSAQALELVELALVNLESSDTLKLTHCSGLLLALPPGIGVLGYQGERPPDRRSRTAGRANHPAALNDDARGSDLPSPADALPRPGL
jgi:hypothetical protein